MMVFLFLLLALSSLIFFYLCCCDTPFFTPDFILFTFDLDSVFILICCF